MAGPWDAFADDALAQASRAQPYIEPPAQPGLGELFSAGRTLARGDRWDAEQLRRKRGWAPIVQALGLPERDNPGNWRSEIELNPSSLDGSALPISLGWTRARQEQALIAKIRESKARGQLRDVPDTPAGLEARFLDEEKGARATARTTSEQASGFAARASEFAGGMVETMSDPINVATMMLGGPGKTILQRALSEAAVNAGVELAQQPVVAANRAKLGETYGLTDAATSVAMAGVGAAALSGGGEVLARGARAGWNRVFPEAPADAIGKALKRSIEAGTLDSRVTIAEVDGRFHDPEGAALTRAERDAREVVRGDVALREDNPFDDTPEGVALHARKSDAARQAIETGRPTSAAAATYATTPFAAVKERIVAKESASAGGYDAVVYGLRAPKKPTAMTMGEVFDFQRGELRGATRGRRAADDIGSTGMGAYQFESLTLASNAEAAFGKSWRDVPFTGANQDRVAETLWNRVRGKPELLANTWAAFKGERGGGASAQLAAAAEPLPPPKVRPELIEAAEAPTPSEARFDVTPYIDRLRSEVKSSRSLNPVALGKALDLPPEQAERALATFASTPNSGLYAVGSGLFAGQVRRVPVRKGPVDLLTQLGDAGGLRDNEGHSLAGAMQLQTMIPGRGPLIHSRGMAIDRAGEWLHERGWFGPPTEADTPTTAEVLDLLERAGRGKVYHPDEMAETVYARQAADREDDMEFVARRDALAGEVREEWGMDLNLHEASELFDAVRGGAERDEAVARLLNRRAARDEATLYDPEAEQPQAYDVPEDYAPATMFDAPGGPDDDAQIDSLAHDVARMIETGEIDGEFAVAGVADGDGRAAPILEDAKAILAELDEEDAAIAALEACL